MQPTRPFRQARYDKDMFTYRPTSNRGASIESSRKRKSSSYDQQISVPAPTHSYSFPRRSGPKSYTGDLQDKEFRNSIPSSPCRESSHFREKEFRNSIPASPRREPSHFRGKEFRNSSLASPRRESSHFRDKEFRNSIPASPRRESSHFREKEFRNSIPASPRRESSHFRDKEFRNSIPASPRRESSHFREREFRNSIPASPCTESSHFREKEFRNSIPASPRRKSSHFRDYYHKTNSRDQRNCAEPCHSDKKDHYETKSECTGYSFSRQLQSPYHKDLSPLSLGPTHKTSKWSAFMTEDFNQFEHHEVNEQEARGKNGSRFQEFWNCGPEKREEMEVWATGSHDQPSKNISKSQTLHQVIKNGAFVADIHDRDCWTYKASGWSPLMTEANHFGSHELNAHVAREANASDSQEFRIFGPQNPEQVNIMASSSYDIGIKNPQEPQSVQQNFLQQQASASGFDEKGCQTHKASKWPPAMGEHFDQQSIAHQEFQNFGPQKFAQMNAVVSSSHEQACISIGASETLKQNILIPGACVGDFDAKCSNEETHKGGSSSNVKGIGEASSFSGFDKAKMFGDNVCSSECDLQHETNKLLQNALRLLSAASGIVASDDSGGEIQVQDDVKLMKLLLDSGIQNLKHSLVETTISKNIEGSPNANKLGPNGEKDSVRLDDQCKYENKASAFTEKLWDGTLQLSSSVSVSTVAFFKSGEKMQDFNWSESVEVKGKVRLEAFEKYVQDLPRSRSRGLMVMSFCCKEGSSDAGLEDMKEVAQKYTERKKVGFAQLSNGVDLYICPHSDAVITILAKHGFFKGMAAVRDKSDPLIGCVVWRKNPSSVPPLKSVEVNTPQSSSEPSLRSPSGSSAQLVQSESSTVVKNNQETISLSSYVGEGTSKGDKHSEFETNMELDKPNLQPPTTVAEHSAASSSSDDDDLPEYDFGAVVSQALGNQTSDAGVVGLGFASEKSRDGDVPRSMSSQMISESSIVSSALPDFHFQGLASQSMGHRSSYGLSLPIEPHQQIRERTESSKPPDSHFQGPIQQNLGHMPELHNSSLSGHEKKKIEKSSATSKSSTLFDDDEDDDIPEWCPPGFTKQSPEVVQGAGQSFAFSHAKAPTSGFTDSNSWPLPPLPPTPPSAQLQLQNKEYPSAPCLPTSLANKPSASSSIHRSPDFAQNPVSRPWFDPEGMRKTVHLPSWRGSRP